MAQPTYAEAEDFGGPERVAAAVLISGQNPDGTPHALPIAPFTYEWKALAYTNLAGYQAGLAVEVAAGWEPIGVTSGDRTVNPGALSVTYRRRT